MKYYRTDKLRRWRINQSSYNRTQQWAGYIFKRELKCFGTGGGTALNNGSSTCSFAVAANELHICTVILCNTGGYQVCSKTVALYPGHVARALRVLPLPLLSSRRRRALSHVTYFAKSTNFRSCVRRHGKLLRARREPPKLRARR